MSKFILLLLLLLQSSVFTKEIELNEKNTIYINSQIDGASISAASNKLIELNNIRGSESYKIYIVLKSPGGSIYSGMEFIEFANSFKNIDTICIFCASMAHAIVQGINGKRYGTKQHVAMAHRASGGFQGQFEEGELESRLRLSKAVVRSMEQQNANRIGISLKSYKQKVVNEWWTYGTESLQQNVVDQLVSLKCSDNLLNKKQKSTINTILGPMEGPESSACPLAP